MRSLLPAVELFLPSARAAYCGGKLWTGNVFLASLLRSGNRIKSAERCFGGMLLLLLSLASLVRFGAEPGFLEGQVLATVVVMIQRPRKNSHSCPSLRF